MSDEEYVVSDQPPYLNGQEMICPNCGPIGNVELLTVETISRVVRQHKCGIGQTLRCYYCQHPLGSHGVDGCLRLFCDCDGPM